MRCFVSLCVGFALFSVVVYADPPPTPSPSDIAAAISVATQQVSFDFEKAIQTVEDLTVWFLPATNEDPTVMFLYDSRTTAGLMAESFGQDDRQFTVVPVGHASSVQFSQDAQGQFTPAQSLAELGISSNSLTQSQHDACSKPCFLDHNPGACAACTGVVTLWQLRPQPTGQPQQSALDPEFTPQPEPPTPAPGEETPTPSPETPTPEPIATPTPEVPTP